MLYITNSKSMKDCELILNFLNGGRYKYIQNLDLSQKTWIKTGGVCTFWIEPYSIEQLTNLCRFLYKNSVVFELVGQTSNLFFHSEYNPSIVVSTIRVNKYDIEGEQLVCDCGANVSKLSRDMLAAGYAGFSGLTRLPGTVAGSVYGNAGCFSCSISEMLISAEVLMPDGNIRTFAKKDFGFEKRSSKFKRGEVKGVVLTVKLKLQKAKNIDEEYRKSEETKLYRKTNQEGPAKNLGSVFAVRIMRRNLRNKIVKAAMRVLPTLLRKEPRYIQKKSILLLYGYRDLDAYCSDRQINTFIWKDEKAEAAFERYKEMMNKVYKDLQIEIEEKF